MQINVTCPCFSITLADFTLLRRNKWRSTTDPELFLNMAPELQAHTCPQSSGASILPSLSLFVFILNQKKYWNQLKISDSANLCLFLNTWDSHLCTYQEDGQQTGLRVHVNDTILRDMQTIKRTDMKTSKIIQCSPHCKATHITLKVDGRAI